MSGGGGGQGRRELGGQGETLAGLLGEGYWVKTSPPFLERSGGWDGAPPLL